MKTKTIWETDHTQRGQRFQLQSVEPSPFLVEHASALPRGNVLDVAAGYGRNTLYLAEQGFAVHATDRDQEALHALQRIAEERHLSQVTTEVSDLEISPSPEQVFPAETYDVVIVFFYLFRPLFPTLVRALKPGGVLMYETFLSENHLRYHHPRRKIFCLEPGELQMLASPLSLLHYDEGARGNREKQTEVFTARLLARKEKA
jgi:2-polyprenyl-3-methyl-5-hydroxy-6-metoxy-1,4-benzoquinol methylase